MDEKNLNKSPDYSAKKGSERRAVGWDIQNLFKNYFALVSAQVGSVIFSFASALLATRYFGTDGYGSIVAVVAASHTIQILVSWTNVALARFGVEEFVTEGEISKSFWGRSSLLFANLLLILLTAPLWIAYLTDWMKIPSWTALLIIAHFLTFAFWLHIQHALQAAKLLRLQNILLAIERVLIFLSLVIIGFVPDITWTQVLYIYVLSPWAVIIIGIWKLRSFISWRFVWDKKWVRKIVKFSLPLIPFTTLGYFSTQYLDSFFIAQYLTKSDLGVYSIAYQVSGMTMQLPILVGVLLMPMFVTLQSQNEDQDVSNYLQKVLPLMTVIWGVCSTIVAYLSIIALPLIFSVERAQIEPMLWIFIVGSTFAFPLFAGYSPFANAVSATYVSSFLGVAIALVNVVGNFLLIPRFELTGAALATVLSFIVGSVLAVCLLHRRSSLQHEWLWQSFVPSLVGIAYFFWSENVVQSVILHLIVTMTIAFVYRNSVREAIGTITTMRAKFSRVG